MASLASNVRSWAGGASLPRRVHLALGLVGPALLLLFNIRRVWSFTVDDAYISYRYARNLAEGHGLVYNLGERIEGYTNFFWTVLLAAGIKVGLDPELVAKGTGTLAALGSLVLLYRLADRFRPLSFAPCLATWFFASSIVSTGYPVFGLETGFFVTMVLAGLERFLAENDAEAAGRRVFPWSGLVFAIAGLTRPEAPLYLGLPMILLLDLRMFRKTNLLRGLLFAGPILLHVLFRHAYYGGYLPNTLSAKTGNLDMQVHGGWKYLTDYLEHGWPVHVAALFGLCHALVTRKRVALTFVALGLAVAGYVVLVGGDWMPYFRFLAPYEPFAFLLADFGLRELFEARWKIATVLLVGALVALGVHRGRAIRHAQRMLLTDEKVFWDSAAGGVAAYLVEHGKPGEIGVGDIGYIGYATNYPILDLLGLVDPVISKLPGGYTQKTGPGYVNRVFEKMPRYFVFVGAPDDCDRLPFPAQARLRNDRRFRAVYDSGTKIRHSKGGVWCVFEKRD